MRIRVAPGIRPLCRVHENGSESPKWTFHRASWISSRRPENDFRRVAAPTRFCPREIPAFPWSAPSDTHPCRHHGHNGPRTAELRPPPSSQPVQQSPPSGRNARSSPQLLAKPPTIVAGTTPDGVIDLPMALLSFADSAPRAYWLKVGNAYLTFSTSSGASPDRASHHRIAKHAAPLADRALLVSHRAALIAARHQLEEQMRGVGLKRQIAELVDDQ